VYWVNLNAVLRDH